MPKIQGGGVKAVWQNSKRKQIFSWDGFPYAPFIWNYYDNFSLKKTIEPKGYQNIRNKEKNQYEKESQT